MKFVHLDQRTPAWFDWRRNGITATEAVAISGHSPYKTPWRLWAEKTQRVEPPDLSSNPNVQYGVQHEDDARVLFMAKHVDVVMPCCGECDENPIFRASFDGINSSGEPVEIKCPSASTLEEVIAKGRQSEAFLHYQWQVQWQILVSGAKRGWLVFFLGNDKILDFEILRDENMIDEMRTACSDFWTINILKDKAPPKLPNQDIFVPHGADLITWGKAADDYRRIKAEIDRLTECLEEPKETLLRLMGNFKNADFYGVSISHFQKKGSIDYKKLLSNRGIEVTSDELDAFRKASSEVCSFRTSDSEFPTDFNPERNLDIAEAIMTIESAKSNLNW